MDFTLVSMFRHKVVTTSVFSNTTLVVSIRIVNLHHYQQFKVMIVSGELLQALIPNMGKDIEVTYPNEVTFSGFIQDVTTNPDRIVIGRYNAPPGVSPTHTVDIEKAVKIVIDSKTFQ